jgi:hypothetical protein
MGSLLLIAALLLRLPAAAHRGYAEMVRILEAAGAR